MPQPLAEVADLVRERDLERVPRVARVLHHLGGADAGRHHRRLDLRVERLGRLGVGLIVVADQRQRRVAEVVDRRALAEELGVDRDAEAGAVLLARGPFERRNHDVVRRARQHGAADHHHVVVVLVRERLADLLGDPLEIGEVEAAVLAARSADADERQVGVAHRVGRAGRRAQPAVRRRCRESARRDRFSTIGLRPSLRLAPSPALTSTPMTV